MASKAGAKAGQRDVGHDNIGPMKACPGQCCIFGEIIAGRSPTVWREILDSKACGKMHLSRSRPEGYTQQVKEPYLLENAGDLANRLGPSYICGKRHNRRSK